MDAHWLRVAILFGAFIAVGVWEFARPRRAPQGAFAERWASNLSLYFANTIIAALLFPAPDGVAAQLESSLSISLFHWPASAPLLGFAVGFVLLDFLRYATHWLSHRVHFLWRLHAIHHSDPDMDVSTAFRHHPAEFALMSAILWAAFVVIGMPPVVAIVYGVVSSALACLQHGNIRLPASLDRLAQRLLVTPDMHRIHHSTVWAEANSNYAVIFSFWDRLFGTFRQLPEARLERLELGLGDVPAGKSQALLSILLLPLRVRA